MAGLPGLTLVQPGEGQPPTATGAAKMYATTIEPWPPGGSVRAVEDWKNRMSAGVVLLIQQMRVCDGTPVLQGWSPAGTEMLPDR